MVYGGMLQPTEPPGSARIAVLLTNASQGLNSVFSSKEKFSTYLLAHLTVEARDSEKLRSDRWRRWLSFHYLSLGNVQVLSGRRSYIEAAVPSSKGQSLLYIRLVLLLRSEVVSAFALCRAVWQQTG